VRRLALVLTATAALTVPLLATAGAASADPLPHPNPAIQVWTTSSGDVCVTYQYLTTVCTNTVH
jgi:hypothetical protein